MKSSSSLHRWVLLNNSITRSQPLPATTTPNVHVSRGIDEEYEEDEAEEEDSFLFPDAGKWADDRKDDVSVSEAEWLDSLLESLTDDDVQVSVLSVDDEDDEDPLLSPLLSPMSSSEDLTSPSTYYPRPIPVPYPAPYAPIHSPLIRHELSPHLDSPTSLPSDDHVPDVDDLSVPDAIEDTSDDESDALSTPSLRNSTSSSSLVDPAAIPLPRERRRRPRIYISGIFYPFGPDPLPFPENDQQPPVDEEC